LGGLTGVHADQIAQQLQKNAHIDQAGMTADAGWASTWAHNSLGDHGGVIGNNISALLQAMQGTHNAINSAATAFNDVHHASAAAVDNVSAALNNHNHFEALWHH
jgi:hypothetical protein